MAIHVHVSDETSSPRTEQAIEIPFPPATVTIRTIARIAVKRVRENEPNFLPQLYGIDVVLNMALVSDTDADTTAVPDGSRIFIVNHFVPPGSTKGVVYHEI